MGCCQPVLGPIENYYTKKQVDKLITAVTASAVSEAWVENYAYDKATVENKIDTVNEKMERINNRFDDYYTMRETSSATEIADAINAIEASGVSSAIVQTIVSGYTYSKSEIDAMNSEKLDTSTFNVYSGVVATEMVNKAEKTDLTAHTADTSIHVTTSDKLNWNGKQDVLVSGVNIKTINGNSLLGSGNIEIQGGSGSGITSGEVQTMINESISGKTNESDFSAHTADTSIHLTSGEVQTQIDSSISGKLDTDVYSAYTAATDSVINGKMNTADFNIYSAATETKIDAKPNVWMGTPSQWRDISGSTDPNTIYLVL